MTRVTEKSWLHRESRSMEQNTKAPCQPFFMGVGGVDAQICRPYKQEIAGYALYKIRK